MTPRLFESCFLAPFGETDHSDLGLNFGPKGLEKPSTIRAMSQGPKKQIAVYSDDSATRAAIISAVGTRVATDVPEHEMHEFATGPALRAFIDKKTIVKKFPIDLFILDGEAAPEGGLGIARQLKDEVFNCPPVLAITVRKEDAWLAAWSLAEKSVVHPIDPFTLAHTVADLLRSTSLATA